MTREAQDGVTGSQKSEDVARAGGRVCARLSYRRGPYRTISLARPRRGPFGNTRESNARALRENAHRNEADRRADKDRANHQLRNAQMVPRPPHPTSTAV